MKTTTGPGNPESISRLTEADRRFAVAAELLIREFGDSTMHKSVASDYLAEATNGTIQTFNVDDYRLCGWIQRASRHARMIELNPCALLAPDNIYHARITTGVIRAAQEYAGGAYNGRVASLLHAFGVKGADPVDHKDDYAFGFAMPPKRRKLGPTNTVFAVADARLVMQLRGVPKYSNIDDMLAYFADELSGIVVTHGRLTSLVREFLDIPENNTQAVGAVVNRLANRYYYTTPAESHGAGAIAVNGLLLSEPFLHGSGLAQLSHLRDEYRDLVLLKQPGLGRVSLASSVELSGEVATPQAVTSSAQTQDPAVQNENATQPETVKQQDLSRALAELTRGLQEIIRLGTIGKPEIATYLKRIKLAKQNSDVEELRGLTIELKNLYLPGTISYVANLDK
jgi:hypothetical protein